MGLSIRIVKHECKFLLVYSWASILDQSLVFESSNEPKSTK